MNHSLFFFLTTELLLHPNDITSNSVTEYSAIFKCFIHISKVSHKCPLLTLHIITLSLEMSSLLRATNNLEANRIQIYKDVMSSLLGGLWSRGQASAQAQQRLLSVLHGQLLGMEGRLKEERGARMAALAGQCNLETREEMEAEHCREAAEKAQAELLCQHADQQVDPPLLH